MNFPINFSLKKTVYNICHDPYGGACVLVCFFFLNYNIRLYTKNIYGSLD